MNVRVGNIYMKQGKSEGFDSCDRPSNLAQIGFKSLISSLSYSPETLNSGQNRQFFVARDLEIWQAILKTIGLI